MIAAPLEHSGIEFRGLHLEHRPERSYQQVVTTYVVGRLRADYFGVATLPSGDELCLKPYSITVCPKPYDDRCPISARRLQSFAA